MYIFFFKQKTAYEMRISDWSSDVCSSDLDFRSIELPEQDVSVILGNPPFSMPIIDGFIDRSHSILPEDGVAAFILPAHVFYTAGRVMQWNARFALDVQKIPRSLLRRISMPLVWAKFITTQTREKHCLTHFY